MDAPYYSEFVISVNTIQASPLAVDRRVPEHPNGNRLRAEAHSTARLNRIGILAREAKTIRAEA